VGTQILSFQIHRFDQYIDDGLQLFKLNTHDAINDSDILTCYRG